MVIGILKEPEGENRVALLPENVSELVAMGVTVYVESDAGNSSCVENEQYVEVGGRIDTRENILVNADILIKINPPDPGELVEGKVYIAIFNPLHNKELVEVARRMNITSFSLDMITRSTRAQSMDILSSMATIAGYKAVLEAANKLPNFFPMFMTASGTIRPAKILILGAGVAGLQAIATARKLGAVVEVFDIRSAVREEVMSLGGRFIETVGVQEDSSAGGYAIEQTGEIIKRQQELIHDHAGKANVIICTAQVPGKKAPVLIRRETVESMQPGSVIIDLAASTGGNCELTVNNKTVFHNRVRIIGKSNYPSQMPVDASKMFGKNLMNFLKVLISPAGELSFDLEDEIISSTCITHGGKILNERINGLI
ncbi:MAG: NAD(P) transhydrogenase subunit alpha [Bacteroidales bacterium]|nr:MAG: NAD(P) transhydrogenase subunit alpha [Bacteroidales bacterium]